MTFPYRIAWHSLDPTSPIAPIGIGERTDFINIQRLLPRLLSQPDRLSHLVYFHYHSWDAELWCNYDEDRDWIEEVRVKRISNSLQAWIASPREFEYALHDQLSRADSRDPSLVNLYVQQGPLDVRMRPERDDEGNRFIEVNLMCRSTGNGPWMIRFAGKLWHVGMTAEEELLTNSERRRLGISDSDWLLWAGQDPDEDMSDMDDTDDFGASQSYN